MSKTVQVGSDTFQIPVEGENPPYGEELTAFFEAVATALATVQGPNDIPITTAVLANNVSSFTNIPGLLFSAASTELVDIQYLITRIYDSGVTTVAEAGTILGAYDGSDFYISREFVIDAGFEFHITSVGQMQYKSSNLANHVSTQIQFKAKTIDS